MTSAPGGHCGLLGHEVQDSLAAVALARCSSLRRICWATCGRSRTWQAVQSSPSIGATAIIASLLEELLVACASTGWSRRPRTLACALGRQPRELRVEASGARRSSAACASSASRRASASAPLGRLDVGRDGVGRFDQDENLLLDRVFLALGRRDLVEERRVFLVGLDGGLVIVEARQAAVDTARPPSRARGATCWFSVEPRLRRVHGCVCGGDTVLRRSPAPRRQLTQPPSRRLSGRVQLLKRDERGELRSHRCRDPARQGREGRGQKGREGKGQRAKGKGERKEREEGMSGQRRRNARSRVRFCTAFLAFARYCPLYLCPLPFALCPLPSALCAVGWWAPQDSNLGPTGYEPAALTAELGARRELRWQVRSEKSEVRSYWALHRITPSVDF